MQKKGVRKSSFKTFNLGSKGMHDIKDLLKVSAFRNQSWHGTEKKIQSDKKATKNENICL